MEMGVTNVYAKLLLVGIGISSLLQNAAGSQAEILLNRRLLGKTYSPLVRPARNSSEVVQVSFGMALVQLITVDERNQIMKTNVWLRLFWHDYQLAWDPNDYGNISVFRVDPKKVWEPELVLFNNADGNFEVSYKSQILIYQDGSISFIPPAIYKSSCSIDVEFFPFDEQICKMVFGSWTYNAHQVSLAHYVPGYEYVDLQDYVYSGTWDVRDCPANITFIETPGEPTLTRMEYTIYIRRKTLFYWVNMIVPCVLIGFLSVCVFYLPAEASEKITLSISILLALVVFLLLLQKLLPPTSLKIPLMANFLLFTFILNIISIFFTVIVINWSFRTPLTHRLPMWVRVVFLKYLPKLLFMQRPEQDGRENALKPPGEAATHPLLHGSTEPCSESDYASRLTWLTQPEGQDMVVERRHHPNCKFRQRINQREPAVEPKPMTPAMSTGLRGIRFIANHLKNEEAYTSVEDDWKYIGMVMDRFLLIVFLVVTTAGTFSIFLNNPNIFGALNQGEIRDKFVAMKKAADPNA